MTQRKTRTRHKALSTLATDGGQQEVEARSDREQALVDVAVRQFRSRGYDATSLQEIADELGLLKGSLYHYINSKDDLLWAVILRQHQSILDLVATCKAIDGPADVRLAALVRGYARSLRDDRDFVSVYLRDVNRLSPERRERIITERDRYMTYVVGLLTEGRDGGVFRSDLDPDLSAQGVIGMLNSVYQWYRPEGPATPEQIIEEMLRLIIGGISAARSRVEVP
ncbi:TetR/AcrR family transcriptional regulator [Georgenia sp. SYP-B2076]|uniref:TetR/AcrR family transcriptional regulator n=1 Tax=Georgenia sp. SYP-B2076 TaxID=2495881 RepID=UPI000F8D7747|nr:TetR/AcrR family transcriptional regulator [Georgenia sp. SYP-B2076]